MKLSEEQKAVVNAPLQPMAVTACAGSGKTETAIRRLISIRQKLEDHRGRVVLLSFSNVAVNTFNKGYAKLASDLPDGAIRKRVEVDTLDGFFTQHVLRPHAYRTMGANQAAYLVSGSEPFLNGFQYWKDEKGQRPIPVKDLQVSFVNGDLVFSSDSYGKVETLDSKKAIEVIEKLGRTGAYTHDLGRYWVCRTLIDQPAILRALATRYPQILVDESQDLGTMHQVLLELLMDAGVQVSLIGDVNQGIYAFAGADGTFLEAFASRQGVKGYNLTRNYRSLPSIIDIANQLCGRNDESDRQPQQGGAFFVGYKDAELPQLVDSFKAHLNGLGMQDIDAVILSRGSDRAAKLSGKTAAPGQGTVAMFAEASLMRDQERRFQDAFRLVCKAVVGLTENAPPGLSSALQGTPQDEWMLALRRMLWTFTRNEETGLPLSSLEAKVKWHPQLLKNLRDLLAKIEKEFGLRTVETFGQRMAKRGLEDTALAGAEAAEQTGPGIRVETVHQVKGESIGAVLYVATKANINALLEGTGTEEGRIGYVALTRAKNLFWLAVPNSCLGAMRGRLIKAGFAELLAQ
ncbi:UvrD-helicase domain-containing protein [Pseudomonas aeruginosa]|uniref:ATP-dependent helicase n=6 Tax=Pseudomonas aeruginosa TaxID=287 RepID=UPI00071BC3A0|nr:ATP-dependent helicase [Pseudomonas aeruginosa]EKQ6385109.1 ATP-dependent helicase [Pseudomonas aeruginosa]KSI98741.1 ATP-dependent DNA helicase [Pseudomonas aeruginosa]MBG4856133.1 ATP-dependent helicase [Pseudomonas aeruginosa]MBG4958314.1 ATP-dependent helicase [Pseudomonas aeruginosa]MBG5633926.1 ATP-dependent helicase [Pseudomonas aeruginosa]